MKLFQEFNTIYFRIQVTFPSFLYQKTYQKKLVQISVRYSNTHFRIIQKVCQKDMYLLYFFMRIYGIKNERLSLVSWNGKRNLWTYELRKESHEKIHIGWKMRYIMR